MKEVKSQLARAKAELDRGLPEVVSSLSAALEYERSHRAEGWLGASEEEFEVAAAAYLEDLISLAIVDPGFQTSWHWPILRRVITRVEDLTLEDPGRSACVFGEARRLEDLFDAGACAKTLALGRTAEIERLVSCASRFGGQSLQRPEAVGDSASELGAVRQCIRLSFAGVPHSVVEIFTDTLAFDTTRYAPRSEVQLANCCYLLSRWQLDAETFGSSLFGAKVWYALALSSWLVARCRFVTAVEASRLLMVRFALGGQADDIDGGMPSVAPGPLIEWLQQHAGEVVH